jgi:hypothetical protein
MPVIILIFWGRMLFQVSPVVDPNSLPFWKAIASILNIFPSWINFLLLLVLISGQVIFLNVVVNRHEVLYKNTFLPAFIFALLVSGTPAMMQIHPVYVITLLVLMILDRAFTLFKNDQPVSALFDSGFLSGLAALICFQGIIVFPFYIISLAILRPFRFKEWLITLIGFILPFFLWGTYLFWNHSLIENVESYMMHFRNIHSVWDLQSNLKAWIFIMYVGLLLLLSLVKLRMNYRKNIIRSRSYQAILFILLLFGGAWISLAGNIRMVDFAFLLIPVSVFCAYYFAAAKKRMQLYEYALWGLIAIIAWNHL